MCSQGSVAITSWWTQGGQLFVERPGLQYFETSPHVLNMSNRQFTSFKKLLLKKPQGLKHTH